METKFFEISQNNSGGSFVTDGTLCHRLIIEAHSPDEANDKAVELGCYWDGCSIGWDCSCCGDRWYPCWDSIDLEKLYKEGYPVSVYSHYDDPEGLWFQKYGMFTIIEEPKWSKRYSSRVFEGSIRFKNVEQYAQFLANEYGWTTPDIRIFYLDGTVKEIFKMDTSDRSSKRLISEKTR